MPTRNTDILRQIIEALCDQAPEDARARLEEHFKDKLMVVAGDVETIEAQAQQLRLAITTPESAAVLDYIGEHLAVIPIETTEEVVNLLYPDRFVEP